MKLKVSLLIVFALTVLFAKHYYFPRTHIQKTFIYQNRDKGIVNHIPPATDDCKFIIKTSLNKGLK